MPPQDKQIYIQTQELCHFMQGCQAHMEHKWRHTLWQECMNSADGLFEFAIKICNTRTNPALLLNNSNDLLEELRAFMELTYSLKLISSEKNTQIEERLDEIGKMIGGWLRKCD